MPTLFLTQRFPPHAGPAARRLRHLAEYFAREGKLFVICRGAAREPLPFVAATYAIAANDLRNWLGKDGQTLGSATRRKPLYRFLLPLRQAFPFVYFTDDGGADYRRKALALARQLIREEGIDTVFSSYQPWTDHLVARQLKREFPHLRWVADFRDLPVDLVRADVWWPALQRRWGGRVLKLADVVWTVSEGQRAQLAGWHPRIQVFRNALLGLPPATTAPRTVHFTIVYTGSLYAGLQSAAPLAEALADLLAAGEIPARHLRLLYRGKDADLFREWMRELPAECLDIQTSIAPAAAQKMQQSATLLLLLSWSAPGYYGVLTAKLWDYLASGRPILALVNGPDDPELRGIIAGAAAGAVFPTEEQGEVRQWLLDRYRAWLPTQTLEWSANPHFLRQFLDAGPLAP
ncbi:hypothetical protein QWY85_18830 [Neolewinella lacunae]|uniref:Uncharacterized protein n=1 Tax=Neolewinella lacunae TaxID=1517758 RepID=A0A923T752_9BACT|nr:hypothetical protein [Neolewinella lacunae]MBC6994120.1 hypothetical protein [Neolewinella lacunae]MDN3636731.1 hypothetical protein [Neolewinella lacunae]